MVERLKQYNQMSNLNKIIEVTSDYTIEQLIKNTKLIKEEYKKNQINIVTDFVKIMNEVFERTCRLQEKGIKGKVSVIYFSFLYSNVLLNKKAFRIDIFDQGIFLDDIEVSSEWSYDFIFKYTENDMKKIKNIISSNYIKVKNYELWELKNSYEYNYYIAAESILTELSSCIDKLNSYKKMKKNKEVSVMIGEYMNSPVIIRKFQEDNDMYENTKEVISW